MDIQVGDIYKLDGYTYKVTTVYELYSEVEYEEHNGSKSHKPINNNYLKKGEKLSL
jgi:hypothetical protein